MTTRHERHRLLQQRQNALAEINRAARNTKDWKPVLAAIFRVCNDRAAKKDKVVSFRTKHIRDSLVFAMFAELRTLGYKLGNPFHIKAKHVEALLANWIKRELAPATIQNQLSVLRVFCSWLGKESIVPGVADLGERRPAATRSSAAVKDKSWDGNGIDMEAVATRIGQSWPPAGAWVHLCSEFGLRRKEAVLLDPDHVMGEGGQQYLVVSRGTKGGRERKIPIRTERQREVLAMTKSTLLTYKESIECLSLSQILDKFNWLLRGEGITRDQLGATLHGLRAGYSISRLEDLGATAPVRGGELDLANEQDKAAVLAVMEELGHSRENIGAAYYGRSPKKRGPGRTTAG